MVFLEQKWPAFYIWSSEWPFSRLGGAKAVGPLLMGVSKPFNVLHRDSDMENAVNVIAITVAQAQEMESPELPKKLIMIST